MLIGDGQRVAVLAIAGAEVALEVRRPQIVGGVRGGRAYAGMRRAVAPAAWGDQAFALEDVARGTDRRSGHARVLRLERGDEFLRCPGRVLPPRPAQQRDHVGGQRCGARLRSARPGRPSAS